MYSKSQRKRLGVGWRENPKATTGGFFKMKIYSDDPIVPYKKTQVDPELPKRILKDCWLVGESRRLVGIGI